MAFSLSRLSLPISILLASLVAGLGGCGAGSTEVPTEQAGGAGGEAGASGEGGAAGAAGSVSLGGSGGAGGEGPFDGCHNVDVLFVIDDSGSMDEKQDALIKAFPSFAATMKEKLAGAVSYHVGVVSSDYYEVNPPGCQDLGDLIVRTRGPNGTAKDCGPLPGGKRYLDGADPDLAAHFQCIARVGPYGDDNERLMRGMLNAVKPAVNAPGACNDGFLRPDSLLILVMIADEDDAPDEGCDPLMGSCMTGSGGTSKDWYDELVAARGGVADNVVALGLFNGDQSCAGSIGAREKGFVLRFKNSAVGNVCTLDYGQFFADSLPVIGQACAAYTPIK